MKKILLTFCCFFLMLAHGRSMAETYVQKTNLPTVYINTENKQSITSTETYIYSTLVYVDGDSVARYDSVQIRGRGNSTWNMPKKPYRIKFNTKQKFLGKGYAKAKSWTLIANAADKTMLRNATTSLMGKFMGLKFNPAARMVDLILNDVYMGTYQISDQVEVRENRVNVEEQDEVLTDTTNITGGYLLEVDGFRDGNWFTSNRNVAIRIHYPDEDVIAPKQNNYIKNHINTFEKRLFSTEFTDSINGYRPYVDSTSLANWYIGTEVSANIDGFYSTYFYKKQDKDKLYWGPMWDYDIAYANDTRKGDTSNSLMTDVGYGDARSWMNQMWNDPWFGTLIKRRYQELVDAGMENWLLEKIDSMASYIDRSQKLNYNRWGINTRVYNERVLYSNYQAYVDDLKEFISTHMDYLTLAFKEKGPKVPTPEFVPDEEHYYYIRCANGNKYMDVTNQGTTAGSGICIWSGNKSRQTQVWKVQKTGDYWHFTNSASGLALNDPTEGDCTPTTNLGTTLALAEDDKANPSQLWTVNPVGEDGYYNIINAHTQHTINLVNGVTLDGNRLVSYNNSEPKNSTSLNRQWYFVKGEEIPYDGIEAVTDDVEFAVVYNPSTEEIRFAGPDQQALRFHAMVFDMNGRLLGRFEAAQGFNMASYAKGAYIVKWYYDGKNRSLKFMK